MKLWPEYKTQLEENDFIEVQLEFLLQAVTEHHLPLLHTSVSRLWVIPQLLYQSVYIDIHTHRATSHANPFPLVGEVCHNVSLPLFSYLDWTTEDARLGGSVEERFKHYTVTVGIGWYDSHFPTCITRAGGLFLWSWDLLIDFVNSSFLVCLWFGVSKLNGLICFCLNCV